jgi:hypothetical protein
MTRRVSQAGVVDSKTKLTEIELRIPELGQKKAAHKQKIGAIKQQPLALASALAQAGNDAELAAMAPHARETSRKLQAEVEELEREQESLDREHDALTQARAAPRAGACCVRDGLPSRAAAPARAHCAAAAPPVVRFPRCRLGGQDEFGGRGGKTQHQKNERRRRSRPRRPRPRPRSPLVFSLSSPSSIPPHPSPKHVPVSLCACPRFSLKSQLFCFQKNP